jgi:uncharacterized protein (UPF0179 family)
MNINFTTVLVTIIICATIIVGLMIYSGDQTINKVFNQPSYTSEKTENNLPPNQEEFGMEDENKAEEPELESPEDDDAPMVACTMDAKQCPDGSYVGRVGPDCEFATCPAVEEPVDCTKEVKECSDGSFVGREGPNCEFATCPVVADNEELQAPEDEQIACTMDVKECPDGSFVSRQPPTCEFEACPVTSNPSMQLQTVQ